MKPFQKSGGISSLAVILTLVAGLVSTQALASEVYSWTDENGVVNYSDRPPQGQQALTIDVPEADRPGNSDAYPSPETQKPAPPDAVVETVSDGETPEPKTAAQARREKRVKNREDRNEAQAEIDGMCQKHRQRLTQMEPARRVFYTNEAGESIRMDDDLRMGLIGESKAYIDEHCD